MIRPTPAARGAGAFTLIELLTVITIVALLVGILLPAVGMVRDAARGTVCRGNLRQLVMAELGYADENEGRFTPSNLDAAAGSPTTGWDNLLAKAGAVEEQVQPFGIRRGIFRCPRVAMADIQHGGGYAIVRTWNLALHAHQSSSSGQCYRIGAPPSLLLLADTWFGPAAVGYRPGTTHNELLCGRCTVWAMSVNGVGAARHRGRVNSVALDGHAEARTATDLGADPLVWGH